MVTFRQANAENAKEMNRIKQIFKNLQWLGFYANNPNWWRSLSRENRHRMHVLNLKSKSKPENYTFNVLNKKFRETQARLAARRVMYGYIRKSRADNVYKNGRLVPEHLPAWEAFAYSRAGLPFANNRTGHRSSLLPYDFNISKYRNNFTREGTLKPATTARHTRPANAKPAKLPPRGYLPTLKELAYAAAPELAPLRQMSNEQLQFVSNNWKKLIPKRRAPPLSNNAYTILRRHLAATILQRAWKKSRGK